jgi:MFS family permease
VAWAFVADAVPLYALYALLFAATGLSDAEISALLALWTAVAVLAEVPSGALADRVSRRGVLVAAGVLQAAGFALWVAVPGVPAFAAGFVLWGLGGSLASGAFEALLHDGLAAAGAESQFARVLGWVTAAGQVAQLPAAVAAAALFSLGGFALVGWVSVGCCLAGAALAARLPEARGGPADGDAADGGAGGEADGYLATLRAGLAEAAARPAVRAAVLAVAVLSGLDAVEELFPLLAEDWGVAVGLVPLALLGIPLAGAAGAALGGPASRLRPRALGAVLAAAGLGFAAADAVHRPAGLVVVALAYGLYRMVLVVVEARLQERIEGPARATVTSVAGLGLELAALVTLAAWAVGQLLLVVVLFLLVAAALPRWIAGR